MNNFLLFTSHSVALFIQIKNTCSCPSFHPDSSVRWAILCNIQLVSSNWSSGRDVAIFMDLNKAAGAEYGTPNLKFVVSFHIFIFSPLIYILFSLKIPVVLKHFVLKYYRLSILSITMESFFAFQDRESVTWLKTIQMCPCLFTKGRV